MATIITDSPAMAAISLYIGPDTEQKGLSSFLSKFRISLNNHADGLVVKASSKNVSRLVFKSQPSCSLPMNYQTI